MVKIFADGADLTSIEALAKNPQIRGFTTNPTLMKQSGISDYMKFVREVLEIIEGLPISFEVFSDDFDEMKQQASKLARLGENVYVKIPVTNTKRKSSAHLVRELSESGIRVNVTAIFTVPQVEEIVEALRGGADSCVSVFAGRIADAGIDPLPTMCSALKIMAPHRNIELIWASPREVLNIVQAESIGCHIITVSYDLLKKMTLVGKDLNDFSVETVTMFYADAQNAGYSI